jgi:hypothetical protein
MKLSKIAYLAAFVLSTSLLQGCSTEEYLPYETPLQSCDELGTQVFNRKNVGTITESGTIEVHEMSINAPTRLYIIKVSGGLFSKNKRYGACNLPKAIEKQGQKIRFTALVKEKKGNDDLLVDERIELTEIKLIK